MKKIFFVITAATIALCSFSSCSEDEEDYSNWIITKREYKVWSTGRKLIEMWNDTMFYTTEALVIEHIKSFESLSNSKYEYKAEYREYKQ